MSSISRVEKVFARSGINVERQGDVVSVRRGSDDAKILLPADFELELKAVDQLLNFASVGWPDRPQPVRCACATPDFHPGSTAPVGSAVATDADVVIPAAIGTDINCGMRLITTGITQTQLSLHEKSWTELLTKRLLTMSINAPVPKTAFQALFEEGEHEALDKMGRQGVWAHVDLARLHKEVKNCVGLDRIFSQVKFAPEHLVDGQDIVRAPDLGTVGSGNHFVEFQVVSAIHDRHAAHAAGLKVGDVAVMIHSGSRSVGFGVGHEWMDKAKASWPAGHKHPAHSLYALSGVQAQDYLRAMGVAARYAWLNRVILAEWVREALDACVGSSLSSLVVDVPHNVITQENGLNIHRKGSTPAHANQWALLPGSMGDASHLVTGLGNPDWLWSCSHGAGRKIRRQAVRRTALSHEKAPGGLGWDCVTLRQERRWEEDPSAYKPIGPVIASQEQAGILKAAVEFRPWRTFKA